MQTHFFEEPELQFARDFHVCPRCGISEFDVYDSIDELNPSKPHSINVGAIGTASLLEKFDHWLLSSADFVQPKASKQPNLFPAFPGFSSEKGFKCTIASQTNYQREINNSDIEHLIDSLDTGITDSREKVSQEVADIYLEQIKFLANVRNPHVIVCLLPTKLIDRVLQIPSDPNESNDNVHNESRISFNFRCYLKAKAMKYNVPIQLLKERTVESTTTPVDKNARSLQDMATRAWNFFTALYYKSGGIPWKSMEMPRNNRTCYVGVSFYKSLDRETVHTSTAQMFDETGKGVILRGGEAVFDENSRTPHLNEENSFTLLNESISSYNFAESCPPKRIVIHKSSSFTPEEKTGFLRALAANRISTHDFVTIYPKSSIRLFRNGQYPPARGSFLCLSDLEGILYTRGSIDFYRTYPGLYVPNPLHIRMSEQNSSLNHICGEILALTKMNWNKSQFDGKLPITLLCSRSVGNILKYLGSKENIETRYSFYM